MQMKMVTQMVGMRGMVEKLQRHPRKLEPRNGQIENMPSLGHS